MEKKKKNLIEISIHAPHEGERPTIFFIVFLLLVFQSTLPTRGSDGIKSISKMGRGSISIHAPHEGERQETMELLTGLFRISIHAPHEGERREYTFLVSGKISISIHAPHEGERLETDCTRKYNA